MNITAIAFIQPSGKFKAYEYGIQDLIVPMIKRI